MLSNHQLYQGQLYLNQNQKLQFYKSQKGILDVQNDQLLSLNKDAAWHELFLQNHCTSSKGWTNSLAASIDDNVIVEHAAAAFMKSAGEDSLS